jgi:hypothetical protein
MHHDVITNGTLLLEAQKLNSDLGRYVRKRSFSNNLSGRFYENNSLHSHKARAHRIVLMKAKRKQLEKSLLMEEMKITFLDEELKKKVAKRKREEELNALKELSASVIQCLVRKMLAIKKIELQKVEEQIVIYVAQLIQALFRGRRDRRHVQNIRFQIATDEMEQYACTRLQSLQRMRAARRVLKEKKLQLLARRNHAACLLQSIIRGISIRQAYELQLSVKRNHSACLVQSIVRGRIDRLKYTNARKEAAVKCIQCFYRVSRAWALNKAQKKAMQVKAAQEKEMKAKRVPLHERRYSTYSIDERKVDIKRRRMPEVFANTKIHKFTGDRNLSPINAGVKSQGLNCASSQREEGLRSSTFKLTRQAQVRDEGLNSISNIGILDEKNRLARKRASLRARKLNEKSRLIEQRRGEQIAARKEELARLEEKRKFDMNTVSKQIICNDKDSKNVQSSRGCKTKNPLLQGKGGFIGNRDIERRKVSTMRKSTKAKSKPCDVLYTELSFCLDDIEFEEDINENENDLL